MRPLRVIAAAAALSVGAGGLSTINAAEQQLNPKAINITLPNQFKWTRNEAAGNETAVLYGDPDKPGFYVLMFKWLPGHMSRPHWHPHDRMITVFKGTWWVGTGDKFDPDSTVPLPVGSYVTHFGKEIHWDGAKNEEVWLLMAGEGPATSTPASTPPPVQ
jgi:quercetin dioxygenase-like cupin family protein